jgi:hypothetical protein
MIRNCTPSLAKLLARNEPLGPEPTISVVTWAKVCFAIIFLSQIAGNNNLVQRKAVGEKSLTDPVSHISYKLHKKKNKVAQRIPAQ